MIVTREKWLEEIYQISKSENTRYVYNEGIKHWDKYLIFINKKDNEILAELKLKNTEPESYLLLNDFVQYLNRQGLKRTSINIYFAALRSWCATNGIMLFNEYVNKFVKKPKQNKETRIPLTQEIIRSLIVNSPNQIKVPLLVLLSSGMRISECLQLRVKDVNADSDPIQIKLRAETTKTREERMTYISQEAWEMLEPLLNYEDKESLIFVKKFSKKSTISFLTRFGRIRKDLGLLEKYADGRTYHVNVHAFRANFITNATQILNGDIAHALAGHREYLDTYLRLSSEKRAEMYHKLEPYLTVSDEARQRVIILEKDQQINKLMLLEEELDKQKAKIVRLERLK